ncbi:MAG: hypothetical protein Hens2KO_28010 [Henriciella sp.]
MKTAFSLAVAALALAGAAAADTAYIEPSDFAPKLDQTITIETSFNDDCCVPKYPVRSEAFAVIEPDGTEVAPDRIELFANSTMLEHKVSHPGTTRFTTGERLGRKGGEYVLLDGAYHLVNSDDAEPIDVPDGTPVLSSQTATVSDTYVTIGAPTWASVEAPIGRLVITPSAHPSTLTTGGVLPVKLSFDGAPLDNQSLILTRSGQAERPMDEGTVFVSDHAGKIDIPLDQVGTHLIMTRFQAPAPSGADTDIRSYTTSLTFKVGSKD